MTYLLTLLLTFALVAIALLVFMRVGPPVYRVERRNLMTLLELIVSGRATESDWDVFAGVPIRHDEELAAIQRRCLAIAEREYRGGRQLFTPRGIEELAEVLKEMKEIDERERKDG